MSERHSSLKMAAIVIAQNGILGAALFYALGDISLSEITGISALLVILTLATVFLMHRTLLRPQPVADDKPVFITEHPRRPSSLAEIASQASEMERLSGKHIARIIEDVTDPKNEELETSREIQATHKASLENALETMTHVVERLDGALRRLAAGDMTVRLETPFPDQFEGLRNDFNHALIAIEETLGRVGTGARTLRTACAMTRQDFTQVAGAGARQSGAIARTLSEIGGLSEILRARKMQAEHTANIAHNARADMYRPREAIAHAAKAMHNIREASLQIEPAAAEIREIAFQANILAVNASIEAAHADTDAARAATQEIRSLAERAADAAKEISQLSRLASEAAELGAGSMEKASGEFDAISLYTETLKDHADIIAASSTVEIESVATLRTTVMAIAKAGREQVSALDELAGQIGGMEREAATLDDHAGRFASLTVIVPDTVIPPENHKSAKPRAHLRLVKS